MDCRVVQLREERSLLSWFFITSRKRPELDLEHCLNNFEFTIVHQSLFTPDSEPVACTDKMEGASQH